MIKVNKSNWLINKIFYIFEKTHSQSSGMAVLITERFSVCPREQIIFKNSLYELNNEQRFFGEWKVKE